MITLSNYVSDWTKLWGIDLRRIGEAEWLAMPPLRPDGGFDLYFKWVSPGDARILSRLPEVQMAPLMSIGEGPLFFRFRDGFGAVYPMGHGAR